MARKLYVGNLPYTTNEQDLQDLFATAGTVDSINVMRDMATGRARGFAFVEMATDEEAQQAISMLNERRLRRPQPDRQRGASEGQLGRFRRRWRLRRQRRWRQRPSPVRAPLVTVPEGRAFSAL